MGHSFIYRAAQRAEDRPGGRNLGLSGIRVNWRGIRGLRWAQVLSEVVFISRLARGPVVLVLHVGGNDLGCVPTGELLMLMKADLARFSSFFYQLDSCMVRDGSSGGLAGGKGHECPGRGPEEC